MHRQNEARCDEYGVMMCQSESSHHSDTERSKVGFDVLITRWKEPMMVSNLYPEDQGPGMQLLNETPNSMTSHYFRVETRRAWITRAIIIGKARDMCIIKAVQVLQYLLLPNVLSRTH